MKRKACPFKIGDYVRFTPSRRTMGWYQNIEQFGVKVDEVRQIEAIKDGVYLYFDSGQGGWPWNEFTLVKAKRPTPKAGRDGAPGHRRHATAKK